MATYAARRLDLAQVRDSFQTLRAGVALGLAMYAYAWGSRDLTRIDQRQVQIAAHVVLSGSAALLGTHVWVWRVYSEQGAVANRPLAWACVVFSALCVLAQAQFLMPPWRVSVELGGLVLMSGAALLFVAMASLVITGDQLSGLIEPPAAPKRKK